MAKLTPAQKRKRKRIAEAIAEDNPGIDKAKKFRIATAAAQGKLKRKRKK